MALWLVRTGRYGEFESRFLIDNRIYLTWDNLNRDLARLRTPEEFQAVQRDTYPHQSAKAVIQYASQARRFVHEIKKGDWIVVPSKGKSVINIAEVLGPYHFDPDAENPFYHYHDVKWIERDVPRSNFDQDLLNSFGAFSTVCQVQRNDAERRVRAMQLTGWALPALRQSVGEPQNIADDEFDVDLERSARDQISRLISRRFTKHALARLVDAILQARGYTTFLSPEGPDRGIDILAAPGPLGFGSPKLCVQVKSGDSPVDTPTLNQLIGAMQNVHAEHGLLVSWGGFKSSVDKEEPAQFFRVRLWDQESLINELLSCYDKLSADLQAELPLKRIWTVTVSDELG